MMQVLGILVFANELRLNCGSQEWLVDIIVISLTYTMGLVKTIYIRANNKSCHFMLCSAHEDWVTEQDPQYVQVLKKYDKVGRVFFFAQSANVLGAAVLQSINPIVAKTATHNEEDFFPLETLCTFGTFGGWSYIIVYFFQLAQVCGHICASSDIDNQLFSDDLRRHRNVFSRRLLGQFAAPHLWAVRNTRDKVPEVRHSDGLGHVRGNEVSGEETFISEGQRQDLREELHDHVHDPVPGRWSRHVRNR